MRPDSARPFDSSVVCPVLVGRAAVVGAFQQLFDGPPENGGQVVLVAGEAGVGKSRLVAETIAYAVERGFMVHAGVCFPRDRASPYAPLVDLLRARFAGQSPGAVARLAEPFASELAQLLPDLLPGPAATAAVRSAVEPEQRQLLAALAHMLACDQERQPTLVVVEDLHWCDDASLDFLFYLARHAADQPLVLVGTYRDEDADPRLRHWLAQLDRERLAHEVILPPLTRDEVGEMLTAIFGARRSASLELVDTIYSLSEGNPFYVEELLKSLVTSGDIRYVDGAWDWDRRPIAEWRLPRSLQDAVQRRVAELSPAAREVLSLAAVVGRRFDFELLQVVAQVDERTLLVLIKELIAAQLVVEESREQFAFRHALTRQATYAELLARERVALHRTVAEVAEQHYGESAEHSLGDLGYHFYEAESWAKAMPYARRAGERAQRLYAPSAAVEHFTRALKAAQALARTSRQPAPPIAPALASIYRERGRAYETLGDFAHALADYEKALQLARDVGDHQAEWQGLIDLGLVWSGRDYAQAGVLFQRALDLARAIDQPALVAHSLNRVGNWRVNTEQPREALPLHRESLAIFERLDDRRGIATTLDLLGTASYLSADLAGSTGYYQRAAEILQELDDRREMVSTLAMLANRGGSYELSSMTTDASDFAAGVRDGELAIELARTIDWRAGEAFALMQLSMVLGPLGAYARALELAERSLRIAEEIEHLEWISGAHCSLGQIYLDLCALPRAAQHLERALTLAREVGSTFWIQLATSCLGWTRVFQRDFEAAAELLGPVPDVQASVRSLGERWLSFTQAHLALARDDPALALRLLRRVHPPGVDGAGAQDTPRPAVPRGRALTALGRWAEAERTLRAARETTLRQGARPLLWRSHVALGDLYRAQERRDEAQREYMAARAIIEELAAGLPDEELRDEFLRNATATLPRPYRLSPQRVAAAQHGGLTSREREVAALVAQGRSNREIAETLVLGERTVETHVSNILGKLGASSRREIAAWATEKLRS